MPTWLVHGFRWPRAAIRIHIIIQNLDDAAAEWLMAPTTVKVMTENFRKLYPEQMSHLRNLRFIEQYDPEDLVTKDQPHAYVCDQVHEVKLGVDVDEVRGGGVKEGEWAALVELRDKIAPGEKMGWFVVVNGDVERWAPPAESDDGTEVGENGDVEGSQISPISQRSSVARIEEEKEEEDAEKQEKPRGLKKWFGGKARRAKSMKDLRAESAARNSPAPLSPPLPNLPPNPVVAVPPKTSNGRIAVPSRTPV